MKPYDTQSGNIGDRVLCTMWTRGPIVSEFEFKENMR